LASKQDESSIRILGGGGKVEADDLDLAILRSLAKQARISLVSLSSSLGKSPETISHRIKQLEKSGVIQGYRAMIDISKLGMEHYKVDVRLRSMKQFKRLLSYCHFDPNIYQVNRTIGGETLEIEFQVKSLQELRAKLEQFESDFPGTIERYDYFVIFQELKVTYMPDE